MSYKSRSNWNIGKNISQDQWNSWFKKEIETKKSKYIDDNDVVREEIQTDRWNFYAKNKDQNDQDISNQTSEEYYIETLKTLEYYKNQNKSGKK